MWGVRLDIPHRREYLSTCQVGGVGLEKCSGNTHGNGTRNEAHTHRRRKKKGCIKYKARKMYNMFHERRDTGVSAWIGGPSVLPWGMKKAGSLASHEEGHLHHW